MIQSYSAVSKLLHRDYIKNSWMYKQLQGADPFLNRILGTSMSGRTNGGSSIEVPVTIGQAHATSSEFDKAQAQAKQAGTQEQQVVFSFSYDTDSYTLGRVEQKAMYGTRSGALAFAEAADDKLKKTLGGLNENFARRIYSEGFGELGKVSSVSGKTVTLESKNDVNGIPFGQFLSFASARGTSATVRDVGGATKQYGEVVEVDANAGTITFNETLTGVAANDYLFLPGDEQKSAGQGSAILGLKAHLPATLASNDSFGTVNRNLHRTFLGGNQVAATSGDSILDVIRKGAVRIGARYRGIPNQVENYAATDIFLGPSAWEALADEYDEVTEMRRMSSEDLKKGVKGFEALAVAVNGKTLYAWCCPALNDLDGFVLNINTWGLKWTGEHEKSPIGLQTMTNGTYFKDVEDAAEVEFRVQFHPILYCAAPGLNCRLDFSNISDDVTKYAP